MASERSWFLIIKFTLLAVDNLKNVLLWIDTTLERWLSGRKRQIANLLIGSGLSEGSNPSLSVEYHQLAKIQFGKNPTFLGWNSFVDPPFFKAKRERAPIDMGNLINST